VAQVSVLTSGGGCQDTLLETGVFDVAALFISGSRKQILVLNNMSCSRCSLVRGRNRNNIISAPHLKKR